MYKCNDKYDILKGRWVVYDEAKNQLLKNDPSRLCSFEEIIEKIMKLEFVLSSKRSGKYQFQFRLLTRINGYPIIVPVNIWKETIQLITLYPDRRLKNGVNDVKIKKRRN